MTIAIKANNLTKNLVEESELTSYTTDNGETLTLCVSPPERQATMSLWGKTTKYGTLNFTLGGIYAYTVDASDNWEQVKKFC